MTDPNKTIRLEVEAARRKILGFKIKSDIFDVEIRENDWSEFPKSNVYIRSCVLDGISPNMSIANMHFHFGGELKPHKHTCQETIYCLDGEYFDPINQVTLLPGDRQVIPSNTIHAGKSDYCLLTVTWQPPFKTITENEK